MRERLVAEWMWGEGQQQQEAGDGQQATGNRWLMRELLERAIGAGGDVSLSGGLDSGVLAALGARLGVVRRAWTIAGEEAERAAAIAAELGIEHRVIEVGELAPAFAGAVRACGAPVLNGKAVAAWLFWRALAGQGVRVVLSGCGADEVLRGHVDGGWGWCRELDADHALAATLAHGEAVPGRIDPWGFVWPRVTLPPEVTAAAACGVRVELPYLALRGWGEGVELVRGELGKQPLRELARELARELGAPSLVALAGEAKRPRLRPVGQWRELVAELLTPARLAPLSPLDPAKVIALRDRYLVAAGDAPELPRLERVLLRVASLVIVCEDPPP